jgi:hypothetical protein
MVNKNGFSLLLFLVYLMLFSITALCTTHIITSLLLPSLSETRINKSLIALHIASDLFVRDIREMRNTHYKWHIITPHELIWHSNNLDTGWRYTENRLERTTGVYGKSGWKSKTTSLVATGITQGTFIVDRDEKGIIGIEMSLISDVAPKKAVVCYGAVK